MLDELSLIAALLAGLLIMWWWPSSPPVVQKRSEWRDPWEAAEALLSALTAELQVAVDLESALRRVGWDPATLPPDVSRRTDQACQLTAELGVSGDQLLAAISLEVRSRLELRARWETASAAATSTSVMLMLLPLAMWGLAEGLGIHATVWLTSSSIGWACVVVSLLLTALSRVILSRLAQRALLPAKAPQLGIVTAATAGNVMVVAAVALKTDIVGLLLGIVIRLVVVTQWSRLKAASSHEAARDVAWAHVCIASALTSGSDWMTAVKRAAECVDGALSDQLAAVAQRLEWGVEPQDAFRGDMPSLDGIARAIEQTHASGAPISDALIRSARSSTAQHHADALKRVERFASFAVIPVTALQLPAFVLIGLVPVVVTQLQPLLSAFSSTGLNF
jgi:Flp pilus assembly protein TadB